MTINARIDFNAVGDGIADDTQALQDAINCAYNGKEYLHIPGGDYLTGTLNMPFDDSATMNRGNFIVGDGVMNTRLIAKEAGTVVFNVVQPAPLKFQKGGCIGNLSIFGGGLSNTVGIRSQAQYSFQIENVEIKDCTIGWNIINLGDPGDYDGCNHITLSNSRIMNCSNWGIKTELRPGNNETSFIAIKSSTIEGCGSKAGEVGGGMYWRGQMLQFDSCAFVLCQNRGLYVEGGAGLGSNIMANNLTFENNFGKHIQCYGITNMEFNNLQMYSNDLYRAQYGIYLSGVNSLISQVRINSAKIRATPLNNPYTAFMALGANANTASIVANANQVRWDNFGTSGQVKYSGFTVV